MVEYARMRLMSFCASAVQAATNSVAKPTTATASWALGDARYNPCIRATRYTPAVTIVAA